MTQAETFLAAYKVALFDFDGTLSLIRTGWQQIMVPFMTETILETKSLDGEEHVQSLVAETVWRLTGKDTIYQMEALAEHVKERGGTPLAPIAYKREYLRRLHGAIAARLDGLRNGLISPDSLLVPGARHLLRSLVDCGTRLYLASGTDQENVAEEARLLRIDDYFEDRIFGARDDRSFSKAALVQELVARAECRPDQLIVFGDGYVEIQEVKKVGGLAVGVASHEPECLEIDDWKRNRLLSVGADHIIPNFLCIGELLSTFEEARR